MWCRVHLVFPSFKLPWAPKLECKSGVEWLTPNQWEWSVCPKCRDHSSINNEHNWEDPPIDLPKCYRNISTQNESCQIVLSWMCLVSSSDRITRFHQLQPKGFILRLGPNIYSSYVASQWQKFGTNSLGPLEKNGTGFSWLNSQHGPVWAHPLHNELLYRWSIKG